MKLFVIVDMQNDFIDGALANPEAEKIVEKIAAVAKREHSNGSYIIATQDTHFDSYPQTLEGKNLPVKHCQIGTRGWKVHDKIKPYVDECVVKTAFGSFCYRYDLTFEPTEIEICGTCTDICVISNALILRSLYPNTPIKVDPRLCAGTTVKNHLAAIEVMRSCMIDIIE